MLPLPYKSFPHVMPPEVLRYHAESAASLFASAGTESLIAYLLSPLGQYYDITRFSLFWYDRVLQAGVSDLDGVSASSDTTMAVFIFTRPYDSPMVQEGIGGLEPVIKNRVDFGQGLKNTALWQDFLRHHAFARLALAERDDMVYYAIFHTDAEDMFPPETVQLQELLRPLSVALLESKKGHAAGLHATGHTGLAGECRDIGSAYSRMREVLTSSGGSREAGSSEESETNTTPRLAKDTRVFTPAAFPPKAVLDDVAP